MNFFRTRWLVMFASVAMAVATSAEQTIIFSKPTDVPAEKADSSLSGSPKLWGAGAYKAPHQIFRDYTPDYPLPNPPAANNNNDASVRDALNKRKNWTLLTPEQILGIQTPEQIMGVPDRTGEKKLSLEEQFLLREGRASATAATNGHTGGGPAFWRETADANPFVMNNRNDENSPFRQDQQKMEPGTRYFNQLLVPSGSALGPDGKPNSSWNSVFTQPTQPKVNPEQQANMEQFRALMEPRSPPDKTPVPTRFSVAPLPVRDPFLQPVPVVNPAGRAVPPLENIFSRPAGIQPLPGISTPAPSPVATKSSSQAQLPPWMQNSPQPHNSGRNY